MGPVVVAAADWKSLVNLSFDLIRDFKINKERSFQQKNTAKVLIQRAGDYSKIILFGCHLVLDLSLYICQVHWFNGKLLKESTQEQAHC